MAEEKSLLSRDYAKWIAELKKRFRATQIKAAVAVNSALIEFYWNLGKDISEKYPGEKYGTKFFDKLSTDLRNAMPDAGGFAKANLIYCLRFYELYTSVDIVPQAVEQSSCRMKSSVCQWELPITNSEKPCQRKPSLRSATAMPKSR